MAYRTTVKTLRTLVATLNDITGNPRDAYRNNGERYVAVPGHFSNCAYGGYRLAQMVSETGGERNITPRYGAAIHGRSDPRLHGWLARGKTAAFSIARRCHQTRPGGIGDGTMARKPDPLAR